MLTVTDIFCGGGGSSTGMVAVPGVEVVMAANHWDLAIAVHNENHPDADHAAVDLHEEDPRFFPTTDILWASPECTKWSQASGGKYSGISTSIDGDLLDLLNPDLVEDEDPEKAIVQRSRLLMFDVLRFVEHHRYAAMVIENVVDIATNAKFAPEWALWRKGLRNLGYDFRVVSLNSMHAQALGDPAPQSRDRLYIVAWQRGNRVPNIDAVLRPLAWCPDCSEVVEAQQAWKNGKTVGKYRSQYVYVHGGCGTTVEPGYLPAAAAIDWSLRGTRIGDRTKPLADKTRRRIAAGIAKYWQPFTAEVAGNTFERRPGVRTWSIYEYLRTLHTTQSKALVVPLEGRAGDRVNAAEQPLRTQTSRHLDALCVPAGGTWNDDARAAIEPHRTMTTRETTAVVEAPFIAELRGGGSDARPAAHPLSTVTASGNHHALVTRHYGIEGGAAERHTTPTDEYLRTLTANGGNMSLLTPYYGASKTAKPTDQPMGALTTVDRHALIQRMNSGGAEMTTPATEYLRTLTTAGHQSVLTPGDIDAAAAQVDDCLFRMLEPHEVAAGMAFPRDYKWSGTRRERVKLAGNAVTPPAARDLIAAVAESLVGAA
ncbi:DNA cytosine methyltransferase [Pimelobacter simplex]|uniref:Modification methylase ScrFIA n=1 Tax=Nocardioides simplex TaxID=2045 RepID=A0A0A1DGT2_NOCSI|nr:DNA cytosine methyltransferase [Pimelobacter simplex]AIY15817.1 Modification methylase ScrFIA [Pimelobacter simplex]MCG8150331.1 DNA cytosine methyltransferase [Pimelobacter simplex]GEB16697.1 DNA cytosine methyltransferase [Pimelobacter simplex]SFM89861.1 DNA (cytosine-5)-methyltransferase 1 [Pimelobacter simplex]